MTILYEILKTSKLGAGAAPDFHTALMAQKMPFAKGSGEEHEYTGAVPVTFTANGQPLLDYLISGNTVQSGTPTPDNPIMPQGTGDKTANLLDVTLFHNGYHINSQGNIEIFTGRIATTTPIDVSNYTSVTFSYTTTRDNVNFIYATFSGNTLVERVAGKTSGFTIDTTNCDKLYLCLYNLSSQVLTADIITAMLNEGSTPLPYEPYGYKIPISSANTTTPVYLGEVETTRQIRKLALTGKESWVNTGGNAPYRVTINDIAISPSTTSIEWYCSHYQSVSTEDSWASYDYCISRTSTTAQSLQFRDVTKGDITAFKQYLQQQYAAGTPVTVWYVLATEETGIINEPLMKIGDYADTVSKAQAGVEIPTVRGTNTFDVLTDVKPSEIYIKYKE